MAVWNLSLSIVFNVFQVRLLWNALFQRLHGSSNDRWQTNASKYDLKYSTLLLRLKFITEQCKLVDLLRRYYHNVLYNAKSPEINYLTYFSITYVQQQILQVHETCHFDCKDTVILQIVRRRTTIKLTRFSSFAFVLIEGTYVLSERCAYSQTTRCA